MCELCAQRISNVNTKGEGKKYQLLQAKCYKKGVMDKLQRAKKVYTSKGKLANTKLLAPSLT